MIAFGHELAGTLRRASVVDALVRQVRENFTPTEVGLCLFHHDVDGGDTLHAWPARGPNRQQLLEHASRAGAMVLTDGIDALLADGSLAPQPDTGGSWLFAPLIAKGRVTGTIAVRGEPGRYSPPDLALLEGLVSQASIALESARLVDLHDDGRRSWQEVVDAISPALCIVDRGGRIRRANRAFADLVNAPPASLIGRPWQAFAPPNGRPNCNGPWTSKERAARSSCGPASGPTRLRRFRSAARIGPPWCSCSTIRPSGGVSRTS